MRLPSDLIFPLLASFSIVLWAGREKAPETTPRVPDVMNVLVPGYDEEGHLSWELRAKMVRPSKGDLYEVANPLLKTMGKGNRHSHAKTTSGFFDLKKGTAWGNDLLSVEGSGFAAKGKAWNWWQRSEKGIHRMVFKDRGEVSFDMRWGKYFVSEEDDRSGGGGCPEDAEPREAPEQTVARANFLELLAVDEGAHRFLLDGNVSIRGRDLSLICSRMEVMFVRDSNSSPDGFGKISIIKAYGAVEFMQQSRVSYCDALEMDVLKGEVLLEGSEGRPARVVDEEWGTASGQRILLEKGKQRARVLGTGKGGRVKLELPPIPSFDFGERKEKP